jgi:hypothetical protein
MTDRSDRSLGELFSELSRDVGTLIRQEITLARVELTQKVSAAGRQAMVVVLGGAVAYAGVLVLLAALVLALVRAGLPAWGAAMSLGALTLVLGIVMTRSALGALASLDLAPIETIQSLKENAEWAKTATTK